VWVMGLANKQAPASSSDSAGMQAPTCRAPCRRSAGLCAPQRLKKLSLSDAGRAPAPTRVCSHTQMTAGRPRASSAARTLGRRAGARAHARVCSRAQTTAGRPWARSAARPGWTAGRSAARSWASTRPCRRARRRRRGRRLRPRRRRRRRPRRRPRPSPPRPPRRSAAPASQQGWSEAASCGFAGLLRSYEPTADFDPAVHAF